MWVRRRCESMCEWRFNGSNHHQLRKQLNYWGKSDTHQRSAMPVLFIFYGNTVI